MIISSVTIVMQKLKMMKTHHFDLPKLRLASEHRYKKRLKASLFKPLCGAAFNCVLTDSVLLLEGKCELKGIFIFYLPLSVISNSIKNGGCCSNSPRLLHSNSCYCGFGVSALSVIGEWLYTCFCCGYLSLP